VPGCRSVRRRRSGSFHQPVLGEFAVMPRRSLVIASMIVSQRAFSRLRKTARSSWAREGFYGERSRGLIRSPKG
jgi:hypothetical protein